MTEPSRSGKWKCHHERDDCEWSAKCSYYATDSQHDALEKRIWPLFQIESQSERPNLVATAVRSNSPPPPPQSFPIIPASYRPLLASHSPNVQFLLNSYKSYSPLPEPCALISVLCAFEALLSSTGVAIRSGEVGVTYVLRWRWVAATADARAATFASAWRDEEDAEARERFEPCAAVFATERMDDASMLCVIRTRWLAVVVVGGEKDG